MNSLSLMAKPEVAHVTFGIFNLSWPNIGFWALVVIIFAFGCWAPMPAFMESDAGSGGSDGHEH